MAAETVILAHGLWMMGSEMSLLKRRLRSAGYHVAQFRYRMVTRSLEHNTERLAEFISKHAGAQTHVIGHSLGGVLALQTLRKYPSLPVSRVICLGSPLVDTSAGRKFIRYGAGRAMLGRTLPEAVFDHPLEEWSGSQEVGVIAGTRSLGLGKFILKLPRPNDGMVTLGETCLPGITDHLELPVTHTGLVLSDTVVEQCKEFLRNGRFRRSSA
jgi:pimeloyl-ACP methyl ester carboxylesterase